MRRSLSRSRRLAATLTAGALLASLAACGGDEETPAAPGSGSGSGSLASSVDLKGVRITVGSKEFTEQKILGKIMAKALKAAGAEVKDQTGLTGTPVVRKALETGEISAYYEYTGTGWINILKNAKPVPGSDAQFTAVKEADAKNRITWLAPAPANNTYAIAANEKLSQQRSPKTISDYARIAAEQPGDAGLCTAAEFVTRDDGLPGLQKTYGFSLPKDKVATLDFGLVYASVAKGNPCNFAVVFATDGQILGNKLTVLEDDKGFFPAYNIAVSMRTDVYDAHKAAYDTLFTGLNKLLTTERMTELNAKVDVDGEPIDRVVDDFLKQNKVV
jgi:osmoprotectant transport system substrate-binding protein